MRYLYSFLFYLLLPFMFLRLLWRSRRTPEYRRRWGERLGFCPYFLNNAIWIHAVSVGETIAAVPLIKEIKARYPNSPILITNMTPTGAARVKAAFGDKVFQAYVPYDAPDCIARFLKRVNPKILIVMETELWPNLFAACKKRNIPLIIMNARLSAKSANGYQSIAPLTRELLQSVTVLASQGYADAERFIQLGMSEEKVKVTGNLKFDLELPQDLATKSEILKNQIGKDRQVWIAASTHPTEEEIALVAHKKIREKHPNALLILVPRHPDRFDSVAQLIKQNGFNIARRSLSEPCVSEIDVYLGDTMGELLLLYSVCDVAFVAGSFAKIGGHNMLEPAAMGIPILTGPQLFNFAEISNMLLSARGMLKVQNVDELAEEVTKFLVDKNYCDFIGKNALSVVDANRGALKKQMDLIHSVLSN